MKALLITAALLISSSAFADCIHDAEHAEEMAALNHKTVKQQQKAKVDAYLVCLRSEVATQQAYLDAAPARAEEMRKSTERAMAANAKNDAVHKCVNDNIDNLNAYQMCMDKIWGTH